MSAVCETPLFFKPSKADIADNCLVLVNYVHYDGIGDFIHGLDFLQEFSQLLKEKNYSIVFIVIENRRRGQRQEIEKKLTQLTNAYIVFIADSKTGHSHLRAQINQASDLVKQLKYTRAIINLSTNSSYISIVKEFCSDKVQTGVISEIGKIGCYDEANKNYQLPTVTFNFRMGLEDDHSQGLKLTADSLNTLDKAKQAFKRLKNSRLTNQLLQGKEPKDETIDSFYKNNFFIPGYIQDINTATGFVTLLANNDAISSTGKNLCLYLNNDVLVDGKKQFEQGASENGSSHFMWFMKKHREQILASSNVRSVTIINFKADNVIEKESWQISDAGKEVLIYTGIYFSDTDYSYLQDLALHFCAVSGDNTLADAISRGLLVFAQYQMKSLGTTVNALGRLAKNYLELTNTEQHALDIYFSRYHQQITYTNEKAINAAELFQQVDLINLAQIMKLLLPHLIQNHNIMTKLPDIARQLSLTQDNQLTMLSN